MVEITLARIVLPTTTPVSWPLVVGVDPWTTTVEVPRADAAKIEGLVGRATRLVVTPDAPLPKRTITVWVLRVGPGSHPQLRSVTIADRRWRWNRRHVRRDYNQRIRSGDRRLLREGVSEQIANVADDVKYRKSTLRDGQPWKPLAALADVLRLVDDSEPVLSEFRSEGPVIEDVTLDDNGSAAVSRMLGFLPGAGIVIDDEDRVVVVDQLDQRKAKQILEEARPPAEGFGFAAWVRLGGIRPAKVHVLFSIEQELRFTSKDEGGYATRGDTSRYMENVLPVPDVTLTLASGRVVTRGTWITVEEAFAAWGAPTVRAGARVTPPAMSHEVVQTAWFTLEALYAEIGTPDPDADWLARIRAIKNHYRRSYRLSPYWRDRILSLRNYRVGIIDPENGTRAPALVVSDYCVTPTQHGQFSQPGFQLEMANVFGYSDDLASAKPAPALVNIESEELCVFTIDYQGSAFGIFDSVLPCTVDNPPSRDMGAKRPQAIIAGTVYEGTAPTRLSADHKVSVVLTAVPCSPNNNDQLHRVTVPASEIVGFVPNATPADGPDWDLRVAMTTARFMWIDAQESQIDKVFGRGRDGSGANPTYPSEILAQAGLLVDGDALRNVARAAAAALYAGLVDRGEGQTARDLAAPILPVGSLVASQLEVTPSGGCFLVLRFAGEARTVDLMQFMDDDTRRRLFRMVQP